MSNILFISPRDNYPYTDGGKIASFFGMLSLAKENNVFYSFLTNNIEIDSISKYEQFNIKAFPFEKNTDDNYWNYPKTFFSKLSFKFNKFYSTKMLKQLSKIVDENNIDIVFCSQAQVSKYGIELKKIYPQLRIYLWEHNIEYKLVKQYAKATNNIFMKIIAYFEYLKTKNYEINSWKNFDDVFFISDSDLEIAQKYNNIFNQNNVIYTPIKQAELVKNADVEDKSFIFSGSLKSYQNKKNLRYFIDNVWKDFVQRDSGAKLYITGNKEDFLLKSLNFTYEELEKYNIINLGFVDDVQNVIQSKKYYVSPTLYGSGIRIKVLEALSLKQVVFVTNIDFNMVKKLKDMENIVLYNNMEDFYKKYIILEANNEKYNHIKENAYSVFYENFTEENFIKRIKSKIEESI